MKVYYEVDNNLSQEKDQHKKAGKEITERDPKTCTCDRHFPKFAMDNFFRRLFFPPSKIVSKYIAVDQVVADLGSGPGYFTIPMAEKTGNGGKVYAADSDPRAVEALESKSNERGLGRTIEARTTSASDVAFIPSSSVDFVFANGLICCMADHAGVLREINRMIKPEGKAYLSVSKFAPRKDPKSVNKAEWLCMLEEFNVLSKGDGLMMRWALIRSKKKDNHSAQQPLEHQSIGVSQLKYASVSSCSCVS